MQGLEFHTTVSEASEEASQFRRRRRRCKTTHFVAALLSSTVVALIVAWVVRASRNNNSIAAPSNNDEILEGENSSNSTNNGTGISSSTPNENAPSCGGGAAAAPSSTMTCSQTGHEDRLGHNVRLNAGQAICNDDYQFGITSEGALVWQDCSSSLPPVVVLHQDPTATWFQMTDTATFQLLDDSNQVLWEATSKQEVHFTPKCLSNPQLDCPYLHLHKSGDVVLNYIDGNGSWNDRKVRRSFPDLF
mmetsp:Transcript_28172/g.46669  ORF Transcript_28172/g.46669 Transcript_28172/m.46669 type:complete len:247 (-) Transcript_28172:107-847(-)